MSRSYANPTRPFFEEDWYLPKWKYYTKKKSTSGYSGRFPKSYRKDVNRARTAKDKRELYKEVNQVDYIGNYSKWNCKDADPWWFW